MEKFYELYQRGNNNYGHDHDDGNHGAGSDIGSHRIGELTEDWWQWAVQLPTGANPFEDKTGQYAAMGDVGRVFYVAGIGGSDADPRAEVATAERSFEVPANSLLLIPTLNWSDSLPENPL